MFLSHTPENLFHPNLHLYEPNPFRRLVETRPGLSPDVLFAGRWFVVVRS